MLTSKTLITLYDELTDHQQEDFIKELYKSKTILTDEEWDMFVEPWIDELSKQRLSRIEGMVKILRRFWKGYEIKDKAIWFKIDKNSKGKNYELPKEYTKLQIKNSSLFWSENDWQYIFSAFETDFFLDDHVKNMFKLGYIFEKVK